MLRTLEVVASERWSVQDELLATLVEVLENLKRITITAHFEGPHDFGPPLRIPRPFDLPPERRSVRDIFAAHYVGSKS